MKVIDRITDRISLPARNATTIAVIALLVALVTLFMVVH
jgi:hypothetical protein